MSHHAPTPIPEGLTHFIPQPPSLWLPSRGSHPLLPVGGWDEQIPFYPCLDLGKVSALKMPHKYFFLECYVSINHRASLDWSFWFHFLSDQENQYLTNLLTQREISGKKLILDTSSRKPHANFSISEGCSHHCRFRNILKPPSFLKSLETSCFSSII